MIGVWSMQANLKNAFLVKDYVRKHIRKRNYKKR